MAICQRTGNFKLNPLQWLLQAVLSNEPVRTQAA